MKSGLHKLVTALFGFLIAGNVFAQAEVDQNLPEYSRISGLSGNLSSVGSDTLANLVTLWAEEFKRAHPQVNIRIQAAGSSTAPLALTDGLSTLGPMSRLMDDQEIEAFESKAGYKPTPIVVAIDALAIFVHKDNPIDGLTIKQADAVFSSTRKCGAPADITSWGQLGLEGEWQERDIRLYGRNSVSGTFVYFRRHALCAGEFKPSVNEQPGSASVVKSVNASLNAIGYSGIGYTTPDVRAVPLSRDINKPFVAATPENAVAGIYPLARFLYVYVNKNPLEPLDPVTREFLNLVLSRQGQNLVVKDGYIPLPARVARNELAKIADQASSTP